MKYSPDPGEDETLYQAVRRFADWVHAAYLSALLFLVAVFNAVISVCLGNVKEWGEKFKSKFNGFLVFMHQL